MTTREAKFGDLKVGDAFSLTPKATVHWNIKVQPANLVGNEWFDAFNVINLTNGEPRTFRDEETVYTHNLASAILAIKLGE